MDGAHSSLEKVEDEKSSLEQVSTQLEAELAQTKQETRMKISELETMVAELTELKAGLEERLSKDTAKLEEKNSMCAELQARLIRVKEEHQQEVDGIQHKLQQVNIAGLLELYLLFINYPTAKTPAICKYKERNKIKCLFILA